MHEIRSDTIVAPATAAGEAALSVVRVAGSAALDIAARMFRGADLAAAASHRAHHGWIVDRDGGRIDEVLALTMRAPAGYTGEDAVEFFCHGSPQVVEEVLAAALSAGARLAEPGEFTRRAFLNGKLDLTQAEAVADLIAAQSLAGRRAAVSQLRGVLSQRLRGARTAILGQLAEIEASIDFVEEGLEFFDRDHCATELRAARAEVEALLETAGDGAMLRSGIRVSLAGAPNVGKSRLFNRMIEDARALVTEYPGTTRDILRETLRIDGIAFVLEDTAGLRHSDDPVERLGIERSHESHAHADIVVQVIEVGRELSAEEAENLRDLRAQRALIVLNKVDLQASLGAEAVRAAFVARYGGAAEFPASVAVSAATGEGIAALRRALVEHARVRRLSLQNDAVVAVNARHREVLLRALAALQQCECDLAAHEPPEILAAELRRAVITLGEVAGENVSEEVLDRVFARFCIGK